MAVPGTVSIILYVCTHRGWNLAICLPDRHETRGNVIESVFPLASSQSPRWLLTSLLPPKSIITPRKRKWGLGGAYESGKDRV